MSIHRRSIVRPPVITGDDRLPAELPAILRRIYAQRGVREPAELDYSLRRIIPPQQLGGTAEAAALLAEMLGRQGRILIVADFDADGATSCALAIRALRAMGARQVMFMVPNRFVDGYGLTLEIAKKALACQPDLVMTVDNGIASIEGIALLRKNGVQVLVTDHHLAGSQLPDATVIVNPNSPGETFPSKHLAGVGVVFYVMVALRAHLRAQDWFKAQAVVEPNLADYLDLVALGTVADVVKLDHNNRILVQQGLLRIRAGHCCELIQSLFLIAGRQLANAGTADLGFVAGPRLNAAGRLDDMTVGIGGLLEDDPTKALKIANLLDTLNSQRREIELEMKQQALAHLSVIELGEQLPAGLCVYEETWHPGVIGILAARIKERYQRPVIAFAAADEDTLKGSARSVAGLHIRDILADIACDQPHLLSQFGGHAMAAGLSLEKRHLAVFTQLFADAVETRLEGAGVASEIVSDGGLEPGERNFELAEQIARGGPWGQGFPEPLFDDEFEIVGQRTVGSGHAKLILMQKGNRQRYDAIAFNQAEQLPLDERARIQAAYRLDINEYRGERRLQLLIEYFQVC